MKESTPAVQAMTYYFEHDHKGRQGNRVHIASKLSSEFESVKGKRIACRKDFDVLVQLAQNRDKWKCLPCKRCN